MNYDIGSIIWKPLSVVTYAWAQLSNFENDEDVFSSSIEELEDILK